LTSSNRSRILMAEGMRIWNEAGQLVFDTNDRIAGGIVKINTGQTNGSYTATPLAGQSAEFVYKLPSIWIPAGQAGRWPGFTRNGNTLSWGFVSSVPQAQRTPVEVMVVYF